MKQRLQLARASWRRCFHHITAKPRRSPEIRRIESRTRQEERHAAEPEFYPEAGRGRHKGTLTLRAAI
jgi:hypothetical protein